MERQNNAVKAAIASTILAQSNATTQSASQYPMSLFARLVERGLRLLRAGEEAPSSVAKSIYEGYATLFEIIAKAYYGPDAAHLTGNRSQSRTAVLPDLIQIAAVCQRLAEDLESLPTQMFELEASSSCRTYSKTEETNNVK